MAGKDVVPRLFKSNKPNNKMSKEETNQASLIETLKAAGIEGLPKQLTKKQVSKIIELSAQNQITAMGLQAVIQTYPQFIELAKSVAESAKESQTELIKTLNSSQKTALENITLNLSPLIETLNILASNTESDEIRNKIIDTIICIGNLMIEQSRIIQAMNEDNNETSRRANKNNNKLWKWIVGATLLILFYITLGFLGKKSEN